MANLPYARCVLALLVCLGPLPALAQDNPWRVPQYQGNGWQNRDYAPQTNSGGWSQSQPRSDSWAGGYAGNGYAQNGYSGSGYPGSQGARDGGSRWPAPESQGSPQRSWEAEPQGRGRGEAENYAQPQRPQQQARGYDTPAEGWRQNRGYNGYAQDYSGGHANQGYSAPPAVQPPYLYGRQYGEFPPLEGEERKHSAERLQVQPAPPPPPPPRQVAPQAYGYGQGYGGSNYGSSGYGPNYAGSGYGGPTYGQGYGNGAYPDPALAGPSTLGNPPGGYGSPFGTGIPGPYGW